jgi:hypothetical protein
MAHIWIRIWMYSFILAKHFILRLMLIVFLDQLYSDKHIHHHCANSSNGAPRLPSPPRLRDTSEFDNNPNNCMITLRYGYAPCQGTSYCYYWSYKHCEWSEIRVVFVLVSVPVSFRPERRHGLLFKSYYSYVANHDTYPNQFVCTSFCTPTTTTPTHIDRPCWRKSVALSVASP